MKKIINILLIISLLFIFIPRVLALEVSNDNLIISSGDSEEVELYIDVSDEVSSVSFSMFFSTYDIPAYFNTEDGIVDNSNNGIKHILKLDEEKSGKILLGKIKISPVNNPKDMSGTITLSNATYTDKLGNENNLDNKIINVSIGKKEKEKITLKEIKSKIVKIDLVDNVYEYKVQVNGDVDKLDLEAIPSKDSYKVEISNQEIDKLKDGKIVIKVSNGSSIQEYIITVDKLKDVENVEIDDSKFIEENNYKSKWVVVIVILSVIFIIDLVIGKKNR